ncbi:kinesin-like protein KIF23 isoform X1 [Ptychodera flava]|uniref:kinesin-like protein KIF23 isoform X1 n=1 Tax=Ptychodera flava TaxID=63121 RepID=UPI00396A92AA
MKPMRGKTPKKTPRKPQNNVKDPVEVYCRLRPKDEDDGENCIEVINSNTVQLSPPQCSIAYKSGNYKEIQYKYKFVFAEDTSQKALFDHVAFPLVNDLIHGKNGLLFTYGVTGSGKTHTVTGSPQDGGLLPRCLDVLFNSISSLQAKKYVFKPDKMNGFEVQTEADAMVERQKRELLAMNPPSTPSTPKSRHRFREDVNVARVRDTTSVDNVEEDNNYAVFVSYVEIYNNYVYDLLEDTPLDNINQRPPQSKILREDNCHNMYISGCAEVEVKSTEEAYDVFLRGQKRRRVANTQLNRESSRSHSVFNIRLIQAPLDSLGEEVVQDKEQICVSQLSLVDLAGSERTNRTKNSGDRLREAGNINASLMTLRNCIETLRENQLNSADKMVPYRDSKLTHLFKNYFDGEGKVRMVVCVNPAAVDYDENLHVMKFAEVTQEVQVARPTGVRFDVGLTPGRRRANQMYKEALSKIHQDGIDSTELPPLPPLPFTWPEFPVLQLADASDDTTLRNLMTFLSEQLARRNTVLDDLSRKQASFRQMLVEFEREHEDLKLRNAELESRLGGKDKDVLRMEKKLKNLEATNAMLHRQTQLYEQDLRDLKNQVDKKDKDMQKVKEEKRKMQLAMKGIMGVEKDRWEKECAKRVKATQIEMQNKIWVKDEKLRQLKEIVCNKDGVPITSESESEVDTKKPKPPPKPYTRGRAAAHANQGNRTNASNANSKYRSKSPPPVPTRTHNHPPVRLRHRRSKSTNADTWVDHKPVSTLETETVLQPAIKKKKTVAVMNKKDLKADKYILTHQEEDSQGEMETQLIKGDVFTTRGGGHAVQFTDIEMLTQESPTSGHKRKSLQSVAAAEHESESGEWTDVETRCAVGIEGRPGQAEPSLVHTNPKRLKN